MNSKSRYFSSLLIAIVAAFGYYILTDFNIGDIQLKTFSSLGIPFKMYQTNNSVKQKKLPLPKVVFAYSVQQDELKSPRIDAIAESDAEAQEFIAGLTIGLMDKLNENQSSKGKNTKISDAYKYGTNGETAELEWSPALPNEKVTVPNKTECPTFTVKTPITSEDIEMIVNNVSVKNVKKIEECFKKIKVIYGNENAGLKNVIVNVTQNQNSKSKVTCTSTCTETRRVRNATPVANSDDEEEADFDEDSDE